MPDSDDDEEVIDFVPQLNIIKPIDVEEEPSTVLQDSFSHIKRRVIGMADDYNVMEIEDEDDIQVDNEVLLERTEDSDFYEETYEVTSDCHIQPVETTPKLYVEDSVPDNIVRSENHLGSFQTNIERIERARRVQSFKSSMFAHVSATPTKPPMDNVVKPFSMQKRSDSNFKSEPAVVPTSVRHSFSPSLDLSSSFSAPSPKKYLRKNFTKSSINHLIPYDRSIVKGKESNLCDAALFMGRSFRVGWGPSGLFTTVTSSHAFSTLSFRHVSIFGTVLFL